MNAKDVAQGIPIFKTLKLTEIKDVSSSADGAMRLQFTISNESVDRDGDSIDVKGWTLDNFTKNPVVCWAHDYSKLPLGRALKTWKTPDKLMSVVEFTPDELYDDNYHGIRGSTVFRFYNGGYLNAVSAGFYPVEWESMTGKGAMGTHFAKQDLIEFSFVPVPSNPTALVQRDGFSNNEIKSMKKEMRRWIKDAEALCSCSQEKALSASEDTTGGALIGDKDAVQSELGRLQPPPSVDGKDKEDKGDSKMKKGAISFKDAHPDGTPLADKDETWNSSTERGKATKAAHLKAMHAAFKGGDTSDADNFEFPHHGGEPPHPVHLKAVKSIAKKFAPKEEDEVEKQPTMPGDAPGLGYTENDNKVIMDHVAAHLEEFHHPIPWDKAESEVETKEVDDAETKSITASDKSDLSAGIGKENLQDLSAYHRRLHMFAAQGNIMTGFSQADMDWLHAQVEAAMCKLHKAQDPPTDCGPASPLEWKKSVKAPKPEADKEEEKCSNITDVTGAIADRENAKKAEAGEDDKDTEDEEVEPVTPTKEEKKDIEEDGHVTKIGRTLSKTNEAALNEALGHFSEGFGHHDKGLGFHEKVTKAHAKAADEHEEALKCYNKGVEKLKGVLKAMGDKPDEGSEAEENEETPDEEAEEQGKPKPEPELKKSVSEEEELITYNPRDIAEAVVDTINALKKELGLSE